MKYKIAMDGLLSPVYEEVEGEPFVVEGFEGFQFFSRKARGEYNISEVETGMCVAEGFKSLEKAHLYLEKKLKAVGREKMRGLIVRGRMLNPDIIKDKENMMENMMDGLL